MNSGAPLRAFQWDLARQAERLDWLLAQLPRYADWGYEELYLHLEDAIEYPSLPGVARSGAYSLGQMERLAAAAGRSGIKVVPIVNLLGHTQYLLKVPSLRDLNELRAADGTPMAEGQVCPLHSRTLEVAWNLMRDVAPLCTAGKVHVGLDESYHLGRHPLSRAEIAEIGLAGHFARYVQRLAALAGDQGLRLGLWADMLALLPEAIPLLPPGVIAYDWYYYPFRRRPRLELRNFAEYDLAAPLRARGVEYWGCPMDGAFRHEPMPIVRERLANIVSWWRRCARTGAGGMLVTSWEPGRLAAGLPQTVDAAAAGLWLDGEEDPDRLLDGGCRRMFGRRGARAARALRAADKYPFSGYSRWRINERWDTVAGPEPIAPWRAEARACKRLAARRGLPRAVASSLRFRSYVADRDLFVREAGRTVWRVRAALAAADEAGARRLLASLDRSASGFALKMDRGLAAARDMGRLTRDPRARGPNELAVAADRGRLRAWRAWLGKCAIRPDRARSASPVCGAWQLLFRARNFAPAAQKVVALCRRPGGSWRELHGFFLIEFRERAARRRASRTHWFSAPVEWNGPPERFPRLRIAVRGIGQVGIGGVRLTDGARRFPAVREKEIILGRKAASRGYPDFDWPKNRGEWDPAFAIRTRPGARSS
jgi:hypothetical protein